MQSLFKLRGRRYEEVSDYELFAECVARLHEMEMVEVATSVNVLLMTSLHRKEQTLNLDAPEEAATRRINSVKAEVKETREEKELRLAEGYNARANPSLHDLMSRKEEV